GGGFVYADITASTGDLICETLMSHTYKIVSLTTDNFVADTYYIRAAGGKFEKATEYIEGLVYYTREESTGANYMAVIDTTGGKITDNKSEYYYWYINGSTINYQVNITGYIGSEDTAFSEGNIIPTHSQELRYVLFGISEVGEGKLSTAIDTEKYKLVQTDNPQGQEIAIELKMGGNSLGFITYEKNGNEVMWGLKRSTGTIYGYGGKSGELGDNVIAEATLSSATEIEVILHKSTGVNSEFSNMELSVDIELYTMNNEVYSLGTSTLIFSNNFSIIRLVPKQAKFSDASRHYSGVSMDNDIVTLNGLSSFTMEYKTEYIAIAFPYVEGGGMQWFVSTQAYNYYFNKDHGTYLTLDDAGNVVNISETLFYTNQDTNKTVGTGNIEVVKNSEGKFVYSIDGDTKYELELIYSNGSASLPKGTKITMIDLTDESPGHYYYICTEATDSIDIGDFCVMGSDTKISELSLDSPYMPVYLYEYRTKSAQAIRVNERMAFIFDFSAVEWGEGQEEFIGSVSLRHVYNGTDIMDYVESTTTLDVTEHKRSFPISTQFDAKIAADGLDGFVVESEDKSFMNVGNVEITVNLTKAQEYKDTRFDEGDFTVKIELLGADGKPVAMPDGMSFVVGGKEYSPGKASLFAIVPLSAPDSLTGESATEITIQNTMYSLADHLGAENARFRITLYSAPDALYYNQFLVKQTDGISFALKESYEYSLKIEAENRVLESGNKLKLSVTASSGDSEAKPSFTLQKKTDGVYSIVSDISAVLTASGMNG
ncbi:MAG: hypothetical protein IJW21_09985, partial [Clostridia bacterium]|nr:hypothetical protein [Clostridia bacterium]